MSLPFPPMGKRSERFIQEWMYRQLSPDFFDAKDQPLMDRHDRIAQNKQILPGSPLLKMKGYLGRKVRLTRDLETTAGVKFPLGEVLEVYGHWHGKLHLGDPLDASRCIRKVDKRSVEVLDGEGVR